ncbi:hypothetical protein [Alicycliphilus denitrificans]|uniref:hypothetical protein n=1 Tax=Alicycliphilus denitrificans TaxID=179636 RepID=UPI00384FC5BF
MTSSARKPAAANNAFVNASQWDAKHLADMVSRLNDPLVADILVGLLEEYPELKMQYLGVYTKAWETLRRAERIREKAFEAGQKLAERRRKVSICIAWAVRVSRDFFSFVRDEINKARAETRKASFDSHQTAKPTTKPQGDNVLCLPMAQRPTGTDR